MNVFAKAAANAKAAEPKSSKSKKTVTQFVPEDSEILEAVDEFLDAKERFSQAESDKKVASSVVLPWAMKQFLASFAEKNAVPEKMLVVGKSGKTVSLIVQDRSGRYDVSTEALDTLKNLIGPEKAEGLIEETIEFGFDNEILAKKGVSDHLSNAIKGLVKNKILTEAEAEKLLVTNSRRVFKKGTLDLLPQLCDNNVELMESVTDALGSNVTDYIQ